MRKDKIITFLLLFLVFAPLFRPGPLVAADLHFWSKELLSTLSSTPQLWRELLTDGMGQYIAPSLWMWPILYVFGALGSLGLPQDVLIRVLGVIPVLVIGTHGIFRLFDYLKINGWPKVVGAFFYLANTYILLLIDGGQIFLALAYAAFPLAFVLYREAVSSSSWRDRLKFSLWVVLLSIFDIRALYLLILLIILDFPFELLERGVSKTFKAYIATGMLAAVILLGFHSYWLIPSILTGEGYLPQGFARPQQVDFLSFSTVGHSLFFLQPHWYKNVFGKLTHLRWEFVFIPFLAFLAPILKPKNRWVGYWLVISLFSLFLSKGSLEPLPALYPWLFSNIPGFSLFRDPTKFFFLTALSYSVLLGVTVSWLVKRIKWIPLLITFYLLLLTWPVLTGRMTGLFSRPVYEEDYGRIADILRKDEGFGRAFWIPNTPPLGYSSPNHPAVNASVLAYKRPFSIGTVGTYEVFNFLREAAFSDELFDVAGIEYIVYPFPDTRREKLKADNVLYYRNFLETLSGLSWTSPLATDSAVPIVKTNSHQGRFFVPNRTWFILGSDDVYKSLVGIPGFRLSENALVFIEENPAVLQKIEQIPSAGILLNKKREVDLAAALLPEDDLIFPASSLGLDPDPSASSGQGGWWKRESVDFLRWRDFLQEKYGLDNLDFDYGGGWAVGEGELSLDIVDERLGKGDVLLARAMVSSKGGELGFYQGDRLIGVIDTREKLSQKVKIKLTVYEEEDELFEYDQANVLWFEVGELVQEGKITIKTNGTLNVVNAIASTPRNEWDNLRREAQELSSNYETFDISELAEREKSQLFTAPGKKTGVSYKRFSPTHYEVTVSGLSGPGVLAFSQSYDSLWTVKDKDDSNALPLYSLINGFSIPGDGSYEITFSPQKYVFPGLVISGATVFLVILGLLFL